MGDGLIDGVQLRFQQHIDDLASHVNTFASDLLESFNARRSPAECHSAIPGGRDSRGKFTVLAGEGTGIVHTAPACGDVDHSLGLRIGLSFMPPLNEAGEFEPCFGEFTGRRAVDPETVDLVIQKLKEGGFYFAEEKYPHIYPHCWRTGDELVFRLVDEWFVDMDWRDEIKEVVDSITWLPASIQGKDRENEWLTNMRDWMISKKRFWGLALPIWANPDDPQEFYVVESLKELEDLAVEGWDVLEGHSPHKPYIDAVKIKHPESGNVLERIPDVGNPWLDAGITPFSTMGFNTDRDEWSEWFPADFVTECFPGQFRNWFYSLLALATMMRHEEATPELKRPFKTLLGHRLVMNEHGQAMHKSDGTAIWFEEAAEQLGVDTMRWMYLAQRPDQDLRFGLRNADEPVTLKTPDGAITETREGFPTCRVTSTPADETRRRVLIPLWNSYAFFTNYAILDGFDPAAEQVPVAERPEIDRWLLSRLQELAGDANEAWEAFDARAFCLSAEAFIDDLSNWYIRRNRKRFWKGASDGFDADKLAAYQTLHHVLVELSKLLAPAVPFLSERLYQNLVRTTDASAPESVHHSDYPAPNADLLDAGLTASTA
ncbi:MAG: class I tRNA ligase family protein, partial [Planctomycetota bacterium]